MYKIRNCRLPTRIYIKFKTVHLLSMKFVTSITNTLNNSIFLFITPAIGAELFVVFLGTERPRLHGCMGSSFWNSRCFPDIPDSYQTDRYKVHVLN